MESTRKNPGKHVLILLLAPAGSLEDIGGGEGAAMDHHAAGLMNVELNFFTVLAWRQLD